ncbi:MAG: metallophosphoesterase [Phycisphaerales bacterium JB063]
MENLAVRDLVVVLLAFFFGAGSIGVARADEARVGDGGIDEPIKAYVYGYEDQYAGASRAESLLTEAGFEVHALPLDSSPRFLDGLIVIGSFASEDPLYGTYMSTYAEDLYHFVDRGNLLLQMTQADQREPIPPFLPTTQGAVRDDVDCARVHVLSPDHPAAQGLAVDGEGWLQATGARLGWETFRDQGGFEVILAADPDAVRPVLMEGAYGQGRLMLCAMALDKPAGPSHIQGEGVAAFEALGRAFFLNLYSHTRSVLARDTVALNITPSPTGSRFFAEGSWTLAVLPDTQVYSLRFPGVFLAQTAWLRSHREERKIEFALHLGDVVNNNTAMEWERASQAMALLDGVLPYAMVPGNHDYGPSGDASTRDTLMNDYFSFDQAAAEPTFGGAYESGKLDNTYHLFEAGGRKWIVIALEWAPRDKVVEWANEIMAAHPERDGILITHAYMNNNDLRYDHTDSDNPQAYNPHHYSTPGPLNDGQQLWDKLVRKHRFLMTLNGHVLGDGTGYLADTRDDGGTCHQMLINFQMRELGGQAYLRLLEFQPNGTTVNVRSYSPIYDRDLTSEDHRFTIELDPVRAD